ncbi:MAG TPA: hypothetical protein VH302_07740 [Bryobacteraceae bacterium]|nr:hypothetical protein [Bryobacteraceae bacterium]
MCVTATTRVQFFWEDNSVPKDFRTGVSLHSHTMYSEESLEMIPRYTAKVPYVGSAVRRQSEEFNRKHGRDLDFANAFWTPPYAPRQAYRLEEKQIQRQFQLPGLVSLTDHDDIRAGSLLRVMDRFRNAPISTEWTIPVENTFFHLGVHNMPSADAPALMQEFAAYTKTPRPALLAELLAMLNAYPDVLLVLNHPLWDEKGLGIANHRQTLQKLLLRHGSALHALELNGLRSWHENRDVIRLARQLGLPAVAGGDRHGREPNAIINLSRAATFPEFVDEVRNQHFSQVVFMPQYHEPLKMRVLQTMIDIVADYPENLKGRRYWSDRIFYREPGATEATPMAAIWNGNGLRIMRQFITVMKLLKWRGIRSALRLALGDPASVWQSAVASGSEIE